MHLCQCDNEAALWVFGSDDFLLFVGGGARKHKSLSPAVTLSEEARELQAITVPKYRALSGLTRESNPRRQATRFSEWLLCPF